MVELTLLNNTQKSKIQELIEFYKYFYLCNKCGSLYGSDYHEKDRYCPLCELKKRKEDK